jgi:hypothetical protein
MKRGKRCAISYQPVGRDPTLGREEHSNVSLAFFYEKQLIVYK